MARDDWLQVFSSDLRPLAQRGEFCRYRKGEVVIREGELGDTLHLIACGRLRAYSVNANGHQSTYGIYGPGECLGEMALHGGPRSATVEALDASQCVVVTRRMLLAHLAEQPGFVRVLMARALSRARSERRFDPYEGDERARCGSADQPERS